jgi:hypothetical protein
LVLAAIPWVGEKGSLPCLTGKETETRMWLTPSLCGWDKILEKNNLEEERFVLAHRFRCFSPRLPGSAAFGPVERRHITMEGMVEERCSQEGPSSSVRPFLPVAISYEFISELIHRRG